MSREVLPRQRSTISLNWFRLCVMPLSVALLAGSSLSANRSARGEEPLRYRFQANTTHQYHTEITVEPGQDMIKYQGFTRYQVGSVNGDQALLIYSGMLMESRFPKPQTNPRMNSRFPFGPRGFGGPPGFPDPFGRPQFAGLSQTSNQITMTPTGAIQGMKGDSQLPYLLGNVSLLPFEVLPEKDETEWTIDSGVSISEPRDDGRRSYRPFGPFASEDPKAVQAGRETSRYKIESRDDKQVVVKKSYQLSSPKANDSPGFDITGSGTWTFDLAKRVPSLIEYSQKLVVHQDNVDTTIPITIKIRMLTAEEIAKNDADAKARLEAHQKMLEEAKLKKEAPLTPEEKVAALTGLGSEDPDRILNSLKSLRDRTPKEPDPEVLAILQTLVKSRNKKVASDAQETLAAWSPVYKKRLDLNKAYASHMPVESTNRKVDESTPLFVGQIVQMQPNRSFWHAAEILEMLPNGRVMVQTRGIGQREHLVARHELQLAPEDVDQPSPAAVIPSTVATNPPATSTTATPPKPMSTSESKPVSATLRTWTNHTGDFKVEATFLSFLDGKVKLRRKDGKEISVPLDRLSEDDQKFVKAQPIVENPFE